MRSLFVAVLCLAPAWAQTAPPPAPEGLLPGVPDGQVAATCVSDGYKLTAGTLRQLVAIMGKEREAATQLEDLLHSYCYLRTLTKLAEKDKLDQDGSTKLALEYGRMSTLALAENNHQLNSASVEGAEIDKYYAANKEKYKQLKISIIYVAFYKTSAAPPAASGKKLLSEAEAKAKAEKLLADVRGGASFAQLARENSDDENSRAKDGLLGSWVTSQFPENARPALDKLKPGETTEPIQEANGYYLFHLDGITYRPVTEVRTEIFHELQSQSYGVWAKKMYDESKVEVSVPAAKK